jgi:hypothetical protein
VLKRIAAPLHVEPAVNTFFNNGRLLTPIGGGVNIQPRQGFPRRSNKNDRRRAGKLKGAPEATHRSKA